MLLRVTALLLAGLLAASAAWAAGDDAAFKKRLRQALRDDPELILEALGRRKIELSSRKAFKKRLRQALRDDPDLILEALDSRKLELSSRKAFKERLRQALRDDPDLILEALDSRKTELSREAFKKRLRQALRDDPDLILEALWGRKVELYRLAREGARQEQRQRWKRGLAQAMKHPLTMLLDESRPVIGPDQAPYTIVEFSDFLCGACALGSQNLGRLMKKHPGQVRLQLKHNPGSELGRQLAVYYEAIGRQDPELAWRFAKLVFQRQEEVGRRKLEAVQEIVKELKVDQAQLARDLADKALARRIDADKAEAKRLKFLSTPTFVINGVAITGAAPVQAFEEVMAKWKKQQEQASRPTADKEVE